MSATADADRPSSTPVGSFNGEDAATSAGSYVSAIDPAITLMDAWGRNCVPFAEVWASRGNA